MLSTAGASWQSIVLFPLRRRFCSRNRIKLQNGVSISAPAQQPLLNMFREIWVDRCYAHDALAAGPGDTIIDIGANIGVFSIWAATTNRKAQILAVEPSSRTCQSLKQNVLDNQLSNVTIIQSACGGNRTRAVLYCRAAESNRNTLFTSDGYGSSFSALETVEVVTLNHLFERFGISKCRLLKLDCEGAEYQILFAATDAVLQKIERIAMEYHVGFNEHTPDELARFLESHGFRVEILPMISVEGGYLHARRPS
ncbi:MAG: FkbM family methyltransferase [Acidobacteria bacterium]|nr:FkbM family methyltransferase [Acidobacteriota bacterium]